MNRFRKLPLNANLVDRAEAEVMRTLRRIVNFNRPGCGPSIRLRRRLIAAQKYRAMETAAASLLWCHAVAESSPRLYNRRVPRDV